MAFALLTGTPITGALLQPPAYSWFKPIVFSGVSPFMTHCAFCFKPECVGRWLFSPAPVSSFCRGLWWQRRGVHGVFEFHLHLEGLHSKDLLVISLTARFMPYEQHLRATTRDQYAEQGSLGLPSVNFPPIARIQHPIMEGPSKLQ
jgi:hypothetical protein